MIHGGHEALFRAARALAEDTYLIVSVARDVNVARIKGRMPRNVETVRREQLHAHPLVDEVVLSDIDEYIPHIVNAQPDIIALGYDQEGEYVTRLAADLALRGLSPHIVRLEPHEPHIYKTSKLIDRA